MKLGNIKIGTGSPPFIIAEMSGNHNQSLDRALSIVDAAAATGVQALKIQTYTADTMTIDSKDKSFQISDNESLWKDKNLYDLYKEAYTPWEWHEAIFQRCKKHNILGFSTPFDSSAVDFLEKLEVPFYKVASFENIDLPLIKRIAKTGKPIIMSTGMASLLEIAEAVDAALSANCKDLVLLKCTSTYPATPESTNLLAIPELKRVFPACEIGLSDHTMGIGAGIASVALGATVIEKHFTLSRLDGGVDSAFSMEPAEMKLLIEETRRAWLALGKSQIGPSEKELKSLVFRRSLYAVEEIAPGEPLSEKNCRAIRPAGGLAPKYYEVVIGMKATKKIQKGTPITWDLLK